MHVMGEPDLGLGLGSLAFQTGEIKWASETC
jgi:hypothetical protein